MISRQAIRRFTTTAIRRSGDDHGGYAGGNLPFDIHNRYKFTLYFTLLLSSGFTTPFLIVRHQLKKE